MSYTTHILPLNGFLFAQKISAAATPSGMPAAFYLKWIFGGFFKPWIIRKCWHLWDFLALQFHRHIWNLRSVHYHHFFKLRDFHNIHHACFKKAAIFYPLLNWDDMHTFEYYLHSGLKKETKLLNFDNLDCLLSCPKG